MNTAIQLGKRSLLTVCALKARMLDCPPADLGLAIKAV